MSASIPEARFGLSDVAFATRSNQRMLDHAVRLAANLTQDPQRDARVTSQRCKMCFYRSSVAGQAFTGYTCGLCHQEHQHPNTNTPSVCMPCAAMNELCHQCGAELNERDPAKPRNEALVPSTSITQAHFDDALMEAIFEGSRALTTAERAFLVLHTPTIEGSIYTSSLLSKLTDADLMSAAYHTWREHAG